MIIATARYEDLPALLSLEHSGFSAKERWSGTSWASELNADDRLVLVNREDDEVVAVACFSVVDQTAELLRVVVRPDRQGRGIARRLVQVGMEWADAAGAERMLLEVRHDNSRGLSLYDAAGFHPIARRTDYYGSGRHAIVMECRLAQHRIAEPDRWLA
ncbi:MAG: GNAT family N-acetyltransferase [Brooklawnia sp.]|uniref:GNAT family N-acetyltransferase n=1 Tax=Brooklawnia sp. TaxID=2699740 RepID=UPI003C747E71